MRMFQTELHFFLILVVFFRGAGTGGLGLAIEGPSEAKMSCKDNKDGSCSVDYLPFTPGDYDINITFGGLHIPGCALQHSVVPHSGCWCRF